MRRGWGDLALAILIVGVVAMMIVPLPRPLLDLMWAANLAGAACLLMAAVFVSEPLRLASFPTILLVATLVRVGLNVSTTRAILAHADAGQVVHSFGTLVVAENLVVGLVVFALITIIQLVVVARGAERVAEVAARFALDAMPGQQMAIDAEVRAGALDAAGAAARRARLDRTSHMYGAMDGAMKFVKGDAIAALVIVLVNLVGGMVIGVGYRGMDAAGAAQTYSLLSVGEGLVAQIPSLLIAIAAGMLVTRVASEQGGAVGDDIAAQIMAQPRAIAAAAILMIVLAAVPGLPLVPFLALAIVAGVFAAIAFARRPRAAAPSSVLASSTAAGSSWIEIDLGAELAPAAARVPLDDVRARLEARTGVVAPGLRVYADRGTADRLGARELRLGAGGVGLAWMNARAADADAIVGAIEPALARSAHELITIDDVQAMLDRASADHPVTVREVVPRIVTLPVLAEVVRALVREQVPVTDLPAVLEAIASAPSTKDPSALADHVRGSLRRQISGRFAPRGQIAAWTVDAMIEDAVRSSIDGSVLALEPALARDIVTAVKSKLGDAGGIVLTSGDIRRHMRALIEPELPDVAVLAPHELSPGVVVRAAGRIEV
ncbi:MAG TPA: flagellar biosynthesis protein FlhA [Kofleriaceae bacterium]|nr:flagellar biosynthesis protein FlhA [Kofleriaceae bacterium]